jgi:hypothetical protein
VQQHGEPGGPLDQRADRGAVQAHDEVSFLTVQGWMVRARS